MRYLALELSKPVSKIGLGTWQFGSREWGYGRRYAEDEASRIVERAVEANVGAVDLELTETDLAGLTAGADAYANGR